jgi:hypothetical protein
MRGTTWYNMPPLELLRSIVAAIFLPALSGVMLAHEPQDGSFQIGNLRFELVYHNDTLSGRNDHFGCLLFDADSRLALHNGTKTWLYTGSLIDAKKNKWAGYVREFDIETLSVGPRKALLSPVDDEKWTAIHLAVQAADNLYVIFYSTGKDVRTAVSERPDGPFRRDPDFRLAPSEDWEKGASLESDCGFVKIANNERTFEIWKLYDTLVPGARGLNGWARVKIDKVARRVELVGKHPGNPLQLSLPGRVAARTGGNLDSNFTVDGKRLLLYLSKPDRKTYLMSAALSADPLFQTIDENVELDGPLGEENVIEKFQWFVHNDILHVIYEVGSKSGDWRTGLRKYRTEVLPNGS